MSVVFLLNGIFFFFYNQTINFHFIVGASIQPSVFNIHTDCVHILSTSIFRYDARNFIFSINRILISFILKCMKLIVFWRMIRTVCIYI